MKLRSRMNSCAHGATLAESALALGVLAVAIPLVSATLGEAARSVDHAGQDSRCPAILAACRDAVERARDGAPGCIGPYPAGTAFPEEGEICALAFTGEGRLLGRVSKDQYEQGLRHPESREARYLARLSAKAASNMDPSDQALALTITIERPASAPEPRRTQSSFHSFVR